jgi:hypothetical protein
VTPAQVVRSFNHEAPSCLTGSAAPRPPPGAKRLGRNARATTANGQALAARLDAADSVRFLLETLFTLDRRPRPYNKYLEWELTRFPLPGWGTGTLLDTVAHISGTGDVSTQRHIFAQAEAAARRAGHGAVLDAWGEDLELMRPR